MSLNITKEQFTAAFENYGKTVYAFSLSATKNKRKALTITRRTFSDFANEFKAEDVKFIKYLVFSIAADKVKAFLNGEELPSDWVEVWDKSVEENQEEKSQKDVFSEIFYATDSFDVKQRQVLTLSVERFSDSDIAELTGVPEATVKWLTLQNKKEMKAAGFSYSKYLKEIKAEIPDIKDVYTKLVEKYEEDFFVKSKKRFPWSKR